jgi:hypothetical protein
MRRSSSTRPICVKAKNTAPHPSLSPKGEGEVRKKKKALNPFLPPAVDGRSDTHRFAVFRDRAAGQNDVFGLQ